jgi:hypothetical protein
MRRRRSLELIAGRVNSDGSIAAGDGFTVTRVSVGQYSLTFALGFRLVAIGGVLGLNADHPFYYSVISERSINIISTGSIGGAAVDSGFSFIVAGVQQ